MQPGVAGIWFSDELLAIDLPTVSSEMCDFQITLPAEQIAKSYGSRIGQSEALNGDKAEPL